jgi:glycosyltransferase involved in cell wall biosynthesis
LAERPLLLVHALAPPTRGGTAVVLHRLLRGLPVEVLTSRSLRARVEAGDELALPGRYRYFLDLGPPIPLTRELWALLDVPLALLAGIRAGVVARRAGARWIVSPFDGGFSQIAGAVAARLSGLPRVAMVFDLWEENAYGAVQRALARLLERRILEQANAVVVWCEEAAEHYRRKHGVACEVLPIPIDPPDEAEGEPSGGGEVLVAGAVYWAQEDAVRRLLRAAKHVPRARVVMLGDEPNLRKRGIVADGFEPTMGGREFQRRVARADVLFLGLSIRSPHPEVIRTATPARLPEYMASGRPLLVHAPAGSHVAEYARGEDFAEVVAEPDDAALAEGLGRVVADPARAAERARRARRLALERHDVASVRARFEALLRRASEAAPRGEGSDTARR